MAEAGKGSRPRPFSVSQAEWDTRWDAIFSRDLKEDSKDSVSENAKSLEAAKDTVHDE